MCLYQGVRVCAFPCLVPQGCWGATVWVGWFPCAIYLCAFAIPKLAELAGGVPVPRCACMCIPMPCAIGLQGSYRLGWMVPVCHLLVRLCHSKVSWAGRRCACTKVCVYVHSHALCHRVAGELLFGLDGSRVPFTCVPLPFQS